MYAYDLERYISSRGFYYEYEDMAPGKIVRTYSDLVSCIETQDFENDKGRKVICVLIFAL